MILFYFAFSGNFPTYEDYELEPGEFEKKNKKQQYYLWPKSLWHDSDVWMNWIAGEEKMHGKWKDETQVVLHYYGFYNLSLT